MTKHIDVEDTTDAEELIKESEEINNMEKCQYKLSVVGTETFTDPNAQLLQIMQVKYFTTSGFSQCQKETPVYSTE